MPNGLFFSGNARNIKNMFSFKAPKQDPLNTRPEIAVENKNNIISVFYTPYWGVTTMVMLTSYAQL